MKPLKAEIQAVTAALQGGHDSPEDGAVAVIEALDAARTDRTLYAVAVAARPTPIIYYGFSNSQEALQWVKQNAIDATGLAVHVLPVVSKDRPLKRHQEGHERIAELNKLEHPTPGRRKRK